MAWRTGGFIGRRVVPTLAGAAIGVWQLGEAEAALRDSIWPYPADKDLYWGNTVLLLHGDGANNSTTFTDSSLSALSISRIDGPVVSTAQSKFGGSSMYFDGNLDGLQLPSSSALDFGTGPYTIEFWARTAGTQKTYSAMVSRWSAAPSVGGSATVDIYNIRSTAGLYFTPATGTTFSIGTNVNDGAWHHLAFVRNGTSAYIYSDGVLRNSISNLSAAATATLSSGRIGRSQENNATDNNFFGYIDDFRVTKGVARYTASTYTVPTLAFPDR